MTLVAIALGYPLVQQLIMSLQEFGMAQQFGQSAPWVGLSNYASILTDSYFWIVTARSLALCAVCASLTLLIGVGMAVLMQRIWSGARLVLQSALVLAWAMPAIAALVVWQWFIDARFGLVNWALSSIGFTGMANFNWLQASTLTFYAVAASVIIWASVPLVALATYAALTQVDTEIVEAAQLDGAGLYRQLIEVVLPLIKPVLVLLAILQIIWDLRVFTQIKVLQANAGNSSDTNVLGTYVYQLGIGGGNYGMASALAMLMLAMVLVITWRYVRILSRQGDITA
ncbi:carbohydrate ABC transporter permease [Arthrobacter alpinus]|uniref:carbohydrate ABC transporter permease n=1 Tax=Arthrobacter alpinus TaxID=656366 RepID=UPI001FCD3345|nr:sugar ABC transporter permease [Arthrobacter alpinus]